MITLRRVVPILMIVILSVGGLHSQNRVSVEISELSDDSLRETMELNTQLLIEEMNSAFQQNRGLDLKGINLTAEAELDIVQMWSYAECCFVEPEIIVRGQKIRAGYQIRRLPAMVRGESQGRDAVISFDSKGDIDAFYFSVDNYKLYDAIMRCRSNIDVDKLMIIFNFIEGLKAAYNRQDIDYIFEVLSDDCLTLQLDEVGEITNFNAVQSWTIHDAYRRSLINSLIEGEGPTADFEYIYIMQHVLHNDIYGVTLLQKFGSEDSVANGWLFFALSFTDDNDMVIHVKAWQPYMVNGEIYPRSRVLQLGNFEF